MAGSQSWGRFALMLALFGGGCWGLVSAKAGDDATKPAPKLLELPPVLKKATPQNAEELREFEKHVQKVIEKVMPAVVGVRVGPGQGSGVIVREDGTILTAGHVSGNPNQNAVVILPNGKTLKGKTLGRNNQIDSGMMKIVDEGKYPFLEMGKSSELKVGQWVIAIGHPGGFRPNRTPVVRVGRILFVSPFLIRTDCTLVGGDSGGPLFDMQGRVIGIHSRIGGQAITENIHVPVDTYHQTWDKLAKGESWGPPLGQTAIVKSAGGKLVLEKQDQLTNEDPKDKVQKGSHCKIFSFKMKAGSTYTIDLISGDKTGKKLDTFLRLEDAAGKELGQDDDGAGFPNARIVHKAIKDGDYRIIATSFEPNQTGAFTLKVLEADFKGSFVTGKVEVLKTIKLPPPAVAELVKKFGEAKIKLHINAQLVDDKGAPQAGKEITFQWEKGAETLKSNQEGVVRWPLLFTKSRKLNAQFPQGIRAMLALTDQDGNQIPLKFGDKDADAETVKSAGGTIVKTFEGTLVKTDPFDLEREKCFRHIHEFKVQAGKTYTFDLVSEDFDSYLRLEDSDRNKLAEDDDGAGFLNSRIVFTPKDDGTHHLVVTTCDPGQFGAYRLTVRETNAVPVQKKKKNKQ